MRNFRVLFLAGVAVLAAAVAGGAVLAEWAAAPKMPPASGPIRSASSGPAAGQAQRVAAQTERQAVEAARAAAAQAAGKGGLGQKWSHNPGDDKKAPSGGSAGGSSAQGADGSAGRARFASLGAQTVSSPLIAAGVVYLGARDGVLRALDLESGRILWTFTAGGPIDASPRLVDGRIYFTCKDGYLYAVNPDGTLQSRVRTGGTDTSAVAADGGLLFFGSGSPNRDVFAVRASDGGVQWRYATGQMVYSTPVVGGGTVFVGSGDGKYYALDGKTGALRWSFATKGDIFRASPALAGSVLYAAAGGNDPNLYALDAGAGQELARFDVGGGYVSSPVVAGGLVYLQSFDSSRLKTLPRATRLSALSYSAGSGFKLVWQAPTGFALPEGFSSTPVVAGGVVYVGSGDGNVYAFDAAGGPSTYSDAIHVGEAVVSSPAVSGTTLVVGEYGGTVHALDLPKR